MRADPARVASSNLGVGAESGATTWRTSDRRSFIQNLVRYRNLYLMLLPGLLGFFVFQYIPSIGGLFVAFTRYDLIDGFFGSEWVGLKWFIQFVNDPFFFRLIRNTFLIGFLSLLFGFPAPIILAVLLNELPSEPYKRVTQTVTYLPHFISTVIIVGLMYNLFSHAGVVNRLLAVAGIPATDFVGSSGWFRPLYIGSGIWQGMGWGSIIYLAALCSIDPQLHEAAILDGANRFQRILHVTLPGLAPTVTVLLILNVSNIVSVGFEKVYLMYHPGIYDVSDVIATYVYRRGIEGFDFSYGAAVGLFQNVVAVALLIGANYVSRRVSENSLW